MKRTMLMNKDFSNQFNNLTLKDIIAPCTECALRDRYNAFDKKISTVINILKTEKDFFGNQINNNKAIEFLSRVRKYIIIDTQRYIWHVTSPSLRNDILINGLLIEKSTYKAIFANNQANIRGFYPFIIDYDIKENIGFYDYWRIDTQKAGSEWIVDPNMASSGIFENNDEVWVCTLDDIPVSALQLFTFNAYYRKPFFTKYLDSKNDINFYIKRKYNTLQKRVVA